ncbi:putative fungal-specific transcription factor [Xylogone sp. PMI_703]|nr:putative fungal-specific transcription factor [Xylogone sp. PMI_703]
MQSLTPASTVDRAQQACLACKSRKRKCDKALPQCSWCSRKGLSCTYSSPGQSSNDAASQQSYTSSIDESPRKSRSLDFPTILFMDPVILQYGQVETPRTTYPVPSHVLQLLGGLTELTTIASTYFTTVHVWMPIISKKLCYEHHLQPAFHCHADIALLFLAMKLITSMLPNELANARTPAYHTAKHFFLEIEASGMMSIQVLQAGLLLALYEVGHAIYPSAYLSIGTCTRYAYALGINKGARIKASKVLSLVELEENKRVWWGIVILDRFLSIGSPGRPFSTKKPSLHDPLPGDDAAWDAGIVEQTSATLYSPTSGHMSKFSLLCQTAALLGEVLGHVSKPVIDQKAYEEEGQQLYQTLQAMISASESMATPDHDQISMIYGYHSALMALNSFPRLSNNVLVDFTDYIQRQKTRSDSLAKKIIGALEGKMIHVAQNRLAISPWGLFCVYQAAVTYLQLSRQSDERYIIDSLALTRQTLNMMRTRWNAAGTYLQLLEAREVAGIPLFPYPT